jgi:adenylate cyclase
VAIETERPRHEKRATLSDPDRSGGAANANAAARIVEWAVGGGLTGRTQAELVAGYCECLVEAGVPIWRASIGVDTLHPLIDAQGYRWLSGEGVREEVYLRATTPEQEEDWRASPWKYLLDHKESKMRRRLARGNAANEFPILDSLSAQGGTDYWARLVKFGDQNKLGEFRGMITSWTTRDPNGFAESDFELIEATLPAMALAFKAAMAVETASVLVKTYLGRDAGERVLRGEIERGQVSAVRRVLWFSDLRDFTKIADTLPRAQLMDLLNAYTDCLVGVVQKHGGEVLKFMGDGILAVFSDARNDVCQSALDAAESALSVIAHLNSARTVNALPVTDFTLALHEGEVLYGNVGSQERLDFTVVGPAVNEVSRIQAMSRSLDQPILVSASFAAACGDQRKRLISVGRYALRGVGQPQELFTLEPNLRD